MKGYWDRELSPSGDGTQMVGGTAREGIEAGERKGDFARSCGLLGAGVLKPVPNRDPLPFYKGVYVSAIQNARDGESKAS